MKIRCKDKKVLLKAALGEINSDLAITNAKIVNMFNGNIDHGTVYVKDGFIAHIELNDEETIKADEVVDAKGMYLIPGLIDSHEHIESSMMVPRNFAKAVIPWGTTTVITDPHEIGNVWGVEGVKYMHDDADDLPMRQCIDIPSCVPAVPGLENAGADFLAKEIEELTKLPRVLGLAEVMDFLAVIHGEDRMMDILDVAEKKGLYLQGHAPFLSGRMLSAYLCGGPNTCHESRDTNEAYEKYRNGMFLDMRDSSMCKNIPAVWDAVKDSRYLDHLCLCTDDRESEDILVHGHMNDVVRIAIQNGMNPIDAIRSATYNTAREVGLKNLGAIAPGYAADMILLNDLEEMTPSVVFYGGQKVAENGKLCVEIKDHSFELERRNSVSIKPLTVDDFTIKAPIENGKVKANIMEFEDPINSLSDVASVELDVVDGKIVLNDPDLKFVAVVNRYQNNDNIAVHVVRGFGTTHGALASTVSHDSHNLTIVYDYAENALMAANELKRVGGGMCAVEDGKIIHTLELPVAGLLSLKPAEELAKDANLMKQANRQLGLTQLENPLLRIVTLALPVVPNAKMSDLGLVDVNNKKLIPLFD
ncbi:MAG: adenine deaminase [Coprobacillus sp.]|nr:adenine deaminase [Coprobacillus sp.]